MSLSDSTTSAGIRKVIEVIGRSLLSRALRRLGIMFFALLWCSFTGRNNADVLALDLNEDDEQHTTQRVKANDRIPRFIAASGVNKTDERIKEYFRSPLKGNAVVHRDVEAGFLCVPDESGPVEFIANVHTCHHATAYVLCQYAPLGPTLPVTVCCPNRDRSGSVQSARG